jgi:hypothetical protein
LVRNKEEEQIDNTITRIEKNLRISRDERKRLRRDFRLKRIEERTKLLMAKATRWKWLAAVIGMVIAAYLVFKFVG